MTDKPTTYKILIIEDDKSIAATLKSAFEARGHFPIVINNGLIAIKELETFNRDSFDVVLLDVNLPGANGWEILAKIRSLPATLHYPVIMLTGLDDDHTEARALYDGANDFVNKPCSMRVLLARIDANVRKTEGSSVIDFDLPYSDGEFEDLSPRETEILAQLVKGYSNKEIAELVFISEQTVRNHVKSIFKKLKVNNRMQAAILGLKYGLIK